jgi:hypothetical protein
MPLAKSLSLKSLSILKTKKERPYLPAGPLSEGNLIFSMPYAAAASRAIAAVGASSHNFCSDVTVSPLPAGEICLAKTPPDLIFPGFPWPIMNLGFT